MRNLVLRAVRRALRYLDVALDPADDRQSKETAPPDNGLGVAIGAFLSSVELEDGGEAEYIRLHKDRLARTLSLLPLGSGHVRALELGSYLHMAAGMERVLGYASVRPAYYSPTPGRGTKSLLINGGPPFTTEIDLFDAESHVYPYADSSFEVVLCCELIEHLLHDPMHMLLESWRVLTDGGLFVLTTPILPA